MNNSFEKEAREYCRLTLRDPDELVGHGHPDGFAVYLRSPRWRLVAAELSDLAAKLLALGVKPSG